MQRSIVSGSILAVTTFVVALGTACSSESERTTHPEARSEAPAQTVAQQSPHGGHEAQHGGAVMMVMDMHFEVVLDPAGAHRVYWSNGAREPLRASAIEAVSMTVKRSGAPAEPLTLTRDPTDAFWVASGTALGDGAAEADVTFNRRGEPAATMTVTRPAVPATKAPAAPGEHGHADEHEHQH